MEEHHKDGNHVFEAIRETLQASPQGREFLAQLADRGRDDDVDRILKAVDDLKQVVVQPTPFGDLQSVKAEIWEMAKAIQDTRQQLSEIRPTDSGNSNLLRATAELDAIATATEQATQDILGHAEALGAVAADLAKDATTAAAGQTIETHVTEILMACSFQDITGQRATKVVNLLKFLELRVNAMIDIWGIDSTVASPDALQKQGDTRSDASLLNGPSLEGDGVSQDDIDRMLNGEDGPANSETMNQDDIEALFG